MTSEQQQTVVDVFDQVAGTFAFMFGERAERDDLPPISEPCHRAEVRFRGALSGSATLLLPATTARALVEAVRDEVADAELGEACSDAVRELLNVICGNLLTALAGTAAVSDLGVPETDLVGPDAWNALLDGPDTLPLLLDELPVLLAVTLVE